MKAATHVTKRAPLVGGRVVNQNGDVVRRVFWDVGGDSGVWGFVACGPDNVEATDLPRAIDLTLSDLAGNLSRELDGLDWSCRIVKVEGDEFYLNAGRQTGLNVRDTLEVFRPGENGVRGEFKGRILVSAFLGIDASMGKALDAKKLDVRDIVRPTGREGT